MNILSVDADESRLWSAVSESGVDVSFATTRSIHIVNFEIIIAFGTDEVFIDFGIVLLFPDEILKLLPGCNLAEKLCELKLIRGGLGEFKNFLKISCLVILQQRKSETWKSTCFQHGSNLQLQLQLL